MSAVDVPFPAMSKEDPTAEGIVGTWFVHDGQAVTAGQLIAEVQVEKVSQDVVAPVAGVIRLLASEEASVRQGALIATIER
jgi:pyruvate/2-oxoglutarate dehydrogenase complex dihydrolipoamide acyltransferase (E2) component